MDTLIQRINHVRERQRLRKGCLEGAVAEGPRLFKESPEQCFCKTARTAENTSLQRTRDS